MAIISVPVDFKVIVAAYNGCIDSTRQSVTFGSTGFIPVICMVSVDSLNRKTVIWTPVADGPYKSVLIYKESSQADIYEQIGELSVFETPVFTDINSNPMQNSSRYKRSLLETCGNETSLSEYHKTIHLTINRGIGNTWNLLWDKYEGFEFSTYQIYRGSSKGSLLKNC